MKRKFALFILLNTIIILTISGCGNDTAEPKGIAQLEQTGEQVNANVSPSEEAKYTDTGDSVAQFQAAYEEGKPIFLYFYTETCPTCIQFDSIYKEFVDDENYQDIAFIKVNANDRANQEFVSHYQIRYVPTLFTYNAAGENVWAAVGPLEKDAFRERLAEIQQTTEAEPTEQTES